ncbi:MAG: leucine-rich repeat domain-containing protein [Verrucomicrobia bacterium]|nr:leucine-rich repeat domain-containing protein [Verrucomicrobiota bacterium]
MLKLLHHEFGAKSMGSVFRHLGVDKDPAAAKINTLFKAAFPTPQIVSMDRIPPQIMDYMSPYVEAESMDIFWSALLKQAPEWLSLKMKEIQFSGNPLERLQQKRTFLEENAIAFQNVVRLDLQNVALKTLPKEIGLISNLRTLLLTGNQLTALPPEIAELKKLRVLNVSSNRLASLPDEIGELDALVYLQMNSNRLKEVPPEIGKLKHLLELNLNDNQLQTLPREIGDLKKLNKLCLENNGLKVLPSTIGNLGYLRHLYLYNNCLISLPRSIGQLHSLKVLSAPCNKLTGLPPEMKAMKKLEVLGLDNNCLKFVPQVVFMLAELKELYVNQNLLTSSFEMEERLRSFCREGRIIGIDANPIELFPSSTTMGTATPEEFDAIYNSLGSKKWMEYIDGVYHLFGQNVFDLGLHGYAKEPGYAKSMNELFQFLGENFDSKLEASFYLEMHKVACSHFRGAATQTLIDQRNVGIFREGGVQANFVSPHYAMTEAAIKEFDELNERLATVLGSSFSLGSIVVTSQKPMTWRIKYHPLTREQVAMVFNLFVGDFHCEMYAAENKAEKLTAIAKLIQHLEWLHPPRDGCGRTDTALLNFLLCKHGFNPVLLKYPYVSSTSGLQEWVEHLKQGMQTWLQVAEELI